VRKMPPRATHQDVIANSRGGMLWMVVPAAEDARADEDGVPTVGVGTFGDGRGLSSAMILSPACHIFLPDPLPCMSEYGLSPIM
jgi:hypothetical protein